MQTETVIKPFTGSNPYDNIYEHDLKTDSVKVTICNNSHCDDTTDRTYVTVDTMYGDDIHINQVDGWISINGTRIQLKGHREGK